MFGYLKREREKGAKSQSASGPWAWATLERASFLKKAGKKKLVSEKKQSGEGTKTVKDLGLKSVIPFH